MIILKKTDSVENSPFSFLLLLVFFLSEAIMKKWDHAPSKS